MKKKFVIFSLIILWVSAGKTQTFKVVSENATDYLYKNIFNEVTFLKLPYRAHSLICDSADVIKINEVTYLIRPFNQNYSCKISFLNKQKKVLHSFFYILKDLPPPTIVMSNSYHKQPWKLKNIATDSLVAYLDLPQKSIKLKITGFTLKIFSGDNLLFHADIKGNKVDNSIVDSIIAKLNGAQITKIAFLDIHMSDDNLVKIKEATAIFYSQCAVLERTLSYVRLLNNFQSKMQEG